jgi:hypothetical protein
LARRQSLVDGWSAQARSQLIFAISKIVQAIVAESLRQSMA